MPRIPPMAPERAEGSTQVLFRELQQAFHKVPNLFATVAHYPQALRPLLEYFHAVYTKSTLPKRVLELAIIKTSLESKSEYCLTLHKAFALEHGVTYDEINSLSVDPRHTRFSKPERAVLDYTVQVVSDSRGTSDEVFNRLRWHFSEAEILNLTLLIGFAQMFGHLANVLGVPMDPNG